MDSERNYRKILIDLRNSRKNSCEDWDLLERKKGNWRNFRDNESDSINKEKWKYKKDDERKRKKDWRKGMKKGENKKKGIRI